MYGVWSSAGWAVWLGWLRVCVRTGVACVWLRAVCASVCVWNVLSVRVMRLVCRPGWCEYSMKILNVCRKEVAKILNVCVRHGIGVNSMNTIVPPPPTGRARLLDGSIARGPFSRLLCPSSSPHQARVPPSSPLPRSPPPFRSPLPSTSSSYRLSAVRATSPSAPCAPRTSPTPPRAGSARRLRACVGVCLGAGVCGRLGARDRVVEDGCQGGLAVLGDGGEDAELRPRFLRDLLGEAHVGAVHVLEAYGVPASQDWRRRHGRRAARGGRCAPRRRPPCSRARV
jgi:hypothetical protein